MKGALQKQKVRIMWKWLNGVRVFRDDDNPDSNNGGGDGGGKKYAEKFTSDKELEKGYLESEKAKTRAEAEASDLRRRLSDIESNNQRSKSEEAATGAVKEAQTAYDKFNEETDWDSLRGKELAEATRKLAKLDEAVEKAKEGHARIKSKSSEETIRKSIIDEISKADSSEAMRLAKTHKIDVGELEDFAKKNECGTYTEAVYRYLYESRESEIKRLSKIEADVTKNREHREPTRDREPEKPKSGMISKEEMIKLAGQLPTAKAFREALSKQ